jgi:hypothetical protein
MSLKTTSPHLSYYIERLFGGIPECLEDSFNFTIEHGGMLELDFKRPEGQSYNPRPARIALIGIKDENINSLELIQLLILSSLIEVSENVNALDVNLISKKINIINPTRLLNLQKYANEDEAACTSLDKDDFKILLSLHIDRMRHSHQGTIDDIKRAFKKSKQYLNNPQASSLRSSLIINNWCEKMQRQFPEI